jgi:hypothetical protein
MVKQRLLSPVVGVAVAKHGKNKNEEIHWNPAIPQRRTSEIQWIPPLSSQQEHDSSAIVVDEQRAQLVGQAKIENQQLFEEAMELVIDDDGFLVPKQRNARRQESSSDEDDTSSSLEGSLEEEKSMSIPYSKLKGLPMDSSTPSFGKSTTTLPTVATSFVDSFSTLTPAPTSHSYQQTTLIAQTPRKLVVPGISDTANHCFVSPLPNTPIPEKERRQTRHHQQPEQPSETTSAETVGSPPPFHRRHESIESTSSGSTTGEAGCRSPFFIPGITAKGRTLMENVDGKTFQPKTAKKKQKQATLQLSCSHSPTTSPSIHKVTYSVLNRVPAARRRQLEETVRISFSKLQAAAAIREDADRGDDETPDTPSSRNSATNNKSLGSPVADRPPTPVRRKPRILSLRRSTGGPSTPNATQQSHHSKAAAPATTTIPHVHRRKTHGMQPIPDDIFVEDYSAETASTNRTPSSPTSRTESSSSWSSSTVPAAAAALGDRYIPSPCPKRSGGAGSGLLVTTVPISLPFDADGERRQEQQTPTIGKVRAVSRSSSEKTGSSRSSSRKPSTTQTVQLYL